MATSTFSGPIVSTGGFTGALTGAVNLPVGTTAEANAITNAATGSLRVVTDNGVGNDETAVVVWTGAAWVVCSGAALS